MKELIENINDILASWNPIGLDKETAKEEYKGYIPSILRTIKNRDGLIECIENILINEMEIGYDRTNELHLRDMEEVCDKIIRVFQEK